MRIRRLSWAGVRLDTSATSIVIDPLVHVDPLAPYMGQPRLPVVPPGSPDQAPVALVTHLHLDHCDVDTLRTWLGDTGEMLCPPSLAPSLVDKGIVARGIAPWESVRVHDALVTAMPAVDGLGEDQLSWWVSDDTHSIVHCGDTMWHGHWWQIRMRVGQPDVAFLPANGARVQFPRMIPSEIHASMNAAEAVAAAKVLGAGVLCPIHFGMFDMPPVYAESPNTANVLVEHAERRAVTLQILEAGATVTLGSGRVGARN